MIVFDLECSQGHLFEGWFDDLQSFEDQNTKKMVSCPYCNDNNVKRVLSPVVLKTHSTQKEKTEIESIDYRRLAKEIMDYINEDFEDLGHNFTKEALKIHYGVAEKRNIKGLATVDEEQLLKDEGIQVIKIPVPKIDDDKKNQILRSFRLESQMNVGI